MKIEEKTKSMKVYQVGEKEFTSQQEAEAHLEDIKKELRLTYYVVAHSPDLTEGRGYQRTSKIAVDGSYHNRESLMHYLANTFGQPLAFVQGVQSTKNYSISSCEKFKTLSELNNFKTKAIYGGLGNKDKVGEIIYVNSHGDKTSLEEIL